MVDDATPEAGAKAERRFVQPGEEVAHAEEYVAGEGTYESGGRVFAAMPGWLELKADQMAAVVHTKNPVLLPKLGDIVIRYAQNLTYDAPGDSQVGSRDAEINASPVSCN